MFHFITKIYQKESKTVMDCPAYEGLYSLQQCFIFKRIISNHLIQTTIRNHQPQFG